MERVTAHINPNLIMCSNDQTRYFKEQYNKQAVTIPTAINLPNLNSSNDQLLLQNTRCIPKAIFYSLHAW